MISTLPPASDAPHLRALVVEDEWPARNYLVELIESTGLADVVGAVAHTSQAREVLEATPHVPVDVVFVDIHLAGPGGERAGLELVRSMVRLRPPAFVLATAYEKYALEAFELGAVDYLLKPFSEERVAQCLRRIRARKPRGSEPEPGALRIVARRKKALIFLEPKEIWAFEAADRMAFVHTEHGTFDLDLSLAAIETSFGRAFTRVHRNWLVNLACIKELERDGAETHLFVGPGLGDEGRGVRVPVSRDRAQPLREMLLANATGVRRS